VARGAVGGCGGWGRRRWGGVGGEVWGRHAADEASADVDRVGRRQREWTGAQGRGEKCASVLVTRWEGVGGVE
jgi:hypothetical protein